MTSKEREENASAEVKKPRNPFRAQRMKEDRKLRQKKRARLVVRNISYKATEESFRAHFEQWGELEEVKLLKRPTGELVGCGFVQYANIFQATKALKSGNQVEFLGRPIYIDWALSKDVYQKKIQTAKKDDAVQESEVVDDKLQTNNRKITEKCDKEEDVDMKAEEEDEPDTDIDTDDEEENSSEDYDTDNDQNESDPHSDDEDEEEPKEEEEETAKAAARKVSHKSNDVTEGCTVFIKNVSFDASDEDLKQCCERFGKLWYAIINRDPISGHSKGTGFVKFRAKESADEMLHSTKALVLMDEVLQCFPALSRQDIREQEKEKKSGNPKDSRNLYLAREGLIMAGSKAAIGVSAADMAKRHQLELIKSQVLKNLNRFVSRNRLSIHNLPLTYDNDKLHQMVAKETGFRPHECRVLRENKITAEHPKGKSKGFGFVSFSTHREALVALRKLNNNPNIFGKQHRPIVGFSIEDRAVHNMKEKRQQRSKLNNPTFKAKLEQRQSKRKEKLQTKVKLNEKSSQIKPNVLGKRKNSNKDKKNDKNVTNKKRKLDEGTSESMDAEFVGEASKPGTNLRMRSIKKIREQAKEHLQSVKMEKKRLKKKNNRKFFRRNRSK